MEFKEGQKLIVSGTSEQIRNLMHYFPVYFFHKGKRVLIFDTINSINPHHKIFRDEYQKQYFEKTYCVRTPLPYDLWARLRTSESFIRVNNINVLLVTSLSLPFRGVVARETDSLVKNIVKSLNSLTIENKLITLIGNSLNEDKSVIVASNYLSNQEQFVEVKV